MKNFNYSAGDSRNHIAPNPESMDGLIQKRKLLTTEEACQLLCMSKATLFRIRKRKHLRAFTYGQKVMFRLADLENFIEKHTN